MRDINRGSKRGRAEALAMLNAGIRHPHLRRHRCFNSAGRPNRFLQMIAALVIMKMEKYRKQDRL